jgi:hypothetical protein
MARRSRRRAAGQGRIGARHDVGPDMGRRAHLLAPRRFISLLAPASAGAALLVRCIGLEWPQGVTALTIPSIDSGPAKVPWQTEGNPIGVPSLTIDHPSTATIIQ